MCFYIAVVTVNTTLGQGHGEGTIVFYCAQPGPCLSLSRAACMSHNFGFTQMPLFMIRSSAKVFGLCMCHEEINILLV